MGEGRTALEGYIAGSGSCDRVNGIKKTFARLSSRDQFNWPAALPTAMAHRGFSWCQQDSDTPNPIPVYFFTTPFTR